MSRRVRQSFFVLAVVLAGATLSDRALADGPVTLTLAQTSFNVAVAWDGTVTGTRTTTAQVSHSDPGAFCDKIAEVDIQIVNSAGIGATTLASYVLPHPLCSFNNSDVSLAIQPFTDAEMVMQCSSGPGTHRTTTRVIGAAIQRSGFGMMQWNAGIRASQTITIGIDCAGPPATTPPASTPPASTGTVGTPPASPPGTSDPKTSITPTYTLSPALVGKTMGQARAAKQPEMKLDPAVLMNTAVVLLPASDKASLDAAKAQLDADYAKYATAAQAYSAAYGVCMNKPYSLQDTLDAGCTDTDTTMVCMRKLFAKCIAPAQATLDVARAPLKTDAAKVSAFATALSGI